MEITEITVGASTSFNHPFEQYANFKPSVTIKATLTKEEHDADAVRLLSERARMLVIEEKERILAFLRLESKRENIRSAIAAREERVVHRQRILSLPKEEQLKKYNDGIRFQFGEGNPDAPTFEEWLEVLEEERATCILDIKEAKAELAKLG